VVFSKLKVLNLDGYEFRSAQATSEKHGKNSVIAQVSQLLSRMYSEQLLALFNGEPIPNTNA